MKIKLFIFLFLSAFIDAQLVGKTFEEVGNSRKDNKKPVMVYFYTDWCVVCKKQKKILEKIPAEANGKIDFISINSEKYRKEITFFGKKYRYFSNGNSGVHRIVFEWAGGRVPAYPFWVFIDQNDQFFTYEGLLKEDELRKILQ